MVDIFKTDYVNIEFRVNFLIDLMILKIKGINNYTHVCMYVSMQCIFILLPLYINFSIFCFLGYINFYNFDSLNLLSRKNTNVYI